MTQAEYDRLVKSTAKKAANFLQENGRTEIPHDNYEEWIKSDYRHEERLFEPDNAEELYGFVSETLGNRGWNKVISRAYPDPRDRPEFDSDEMWNEALLPFMNDLVAELKKII